jgi:hypothetical protein
MDQSLKQFGKDYAREIARREKTEAACHVIELADVPDFKLTFLPEGSISLFAAEAGSAPMATLRDSLGRRDYHSFREALGKQLANLPRAMKRKTKAFKTLASVPVFGEISYGGRTLSKAFLVHPSLPICYAFVPYIGGTLNAHEFRLTQFALPAATPLEALVVLRQPDLSRVERDILKKMPPTNLDMRFGDPQPAFCIVAATLTVAAVAATIVVTKVVYDQLREQQANDANDQARDGGGGNGGHTEEFPRGLSDLAYAVGLGKIDAGAAAKELLELRTRLVSRSFSR